MMEKKILRIVRGRKLTWFERVNRTQVHWQFGEVWRRSGITTPQSPSGPSGGRTGNGWPMQIIENNCNNVVNSANSELWKRRGNRQLVNSDWTGVHVILVVSSAIKIPVPFLVPALSYSGPTLSEQSNRFCWWMIYQWPLRLLFQRNT